MKFQAIALFAIAGWLGIDAPAARTIKDARLFIDEDADCGQEPPTDPKKRTVTATMMPLAPAKLLAPAKPKDGFVSGRLQVDAEGRVTSTEIFQEIPAWRGLKEMYVDSMTAWKFVPGSVRTYCTSITVDVPPLVDPRSGDKFADVEYPTAPGPSLADALGYPSDAYAAGIGGVVSLLIEISPTGTVTKAVAREEDPAGQFFGAAAIEGVKTWRFEGATPGRYRLKVRFTPDPANEPAE